MEKIQTTVSISWRKKGNIICQFHEETKSSSTIDIPDLVMGQNPGTLRYPKIAGQWMVIPQKMAIGFDPPPFPTAPAIPSEATPAAVSGPHCPRPALQRQWRCALAAHWAGWAGWAGAAPHGWPLKAVNFSTKRRRFASQNPLLDKPIGVDHPQTH